ncbi:DUF2325 domain-containing protein [Dethiothermospora halolimnae]|uniref:DUF2325 domain-containing protein n=1 Tax=Dethiothermospora halolimnae TaxID=3114390 RepID=UPI003CCC1205
MTALVVGGDRLGNIPDVLSSNGIKDYHHWPGRKKGMRNKKIPDDVDMVIVLYDYIEHNLTKIVKRQSKSLDIPCIYSKRSCSDLACKLNNCPLQKWCNNC